MSLPHFPRWQPLAAGNGPFTPGPNSGVRLSRSAEIVSVTPLAMQPPANANISMPTRTIGLPLLPSEEVRRCSTFLRTMYQHNQCRGAMALYLDIDRPAWRAVLPQQLVSPSGFRASLREAPAVHLPPAGTWRLAGSVQSVVMRDLLTDATAAHLEVPGFDGVHVLVDPLCVFYPRVILRIDGDELCEVESTTALLDAKTGFESQMSDLWCKSGDV